MSSESTQADATVTLHSKQFTYLCGFALLLYGLSEWRLSYVLKSVDERHVILAGIVSNNDQRYDERFIALDSNVDEVGDKVEVVDDKVADVANDVDTSNAVAVVKSDHVNVEVVEVKTEVKKISSGLVEKSEEIDAIKAVLKLGFKDNPDVAALMDNKLLSSMLPANFFSETPESAALVHGSSKHKNQDSRQSKSIATHCLDTSLNISTCYQKYLEKLEK